MLENACFVIKSTAWLVFHTSARTLQTVADAWCERRNISKLFLLVSYEAVASRHSNNLSNWVWDVCEPHINYFKSFGVGLTQECANIWDCGSYHQIFAIDSNVPTLLINNPNQLWHESIAWGFQHGFLIVRDNNIRHYRFPSIVAITVGHFWNKSIETWS